jgi:hypothetical protein
MTDIWWPGAAGLERVFAASGEPEMEARDLTPLESAETGLVVDTRGTR